MNLIDLNKWKKERAINSDKEIDDFLKRDKQTNLLKCGAFITLTFTLVFSLILLFAFASMTLY